MTARRDGGRSGLSGFEASGRERGRRAPSLAGAGGVRVDRMLVYATASDASSRAERRAATKRLAPPRGGA
jgi:hypothetical protein